MSTLKLKLKKIDPVKYATIATLVTLCIMLITFVPFMLFFSAVGATQDLGGGMAVLGGGLFGMIFGMIFYGIVVFVLTLIAAYILNYVLNKTGGLDIEFDATEMSVSQIGQDFLNEKN